eukprot:1136464-Pelagomonas_calceolata.AAC.7
MKRGHMHVHVKPVVSRALVGCQLLKAFGGCACTRGMLCQFAGREHSLDLYLAEAMVTMGGDLQPGRLADRLVAGLCQPKMNP